MLNQHSHDISLHENVLAHVLFPDSAQPSKASNVTGRFPILWVGSGDETRLCRVLRPSSQIHHSGQSPFCGWGGLSLELLYPRGGATPHAHNSSTSTLECNWAMPLNIRTPLPLWKTKFETPPWDMKFLFSDPWTM